MEHKCLGIYEKYFKRTLDLAAGVAFLLAFCWLYALTALAVRVSMGSPVLFRQERPGKDEKVFTMYKFRTMTNRCDENGRLLPDSVRLTPFGAFLRSLSLDEIPEVINIIKGDMSFVGPRPLLVRYLPLYSERQKRRHEVRPGLTGLSQISGRNALPWEERLETDVRYVDAITFREDMRILIKTVGTVLGRKNISSETSCTVEEFTGQ